jgi:xylulokinase
VIHAFRGIDIGTTATKVILVDLAGQIVAETEKPATLHSPQAGWAEEDADRWWANVCVAVPECLCMAGVEARQIAAVGASGMVPTVVLLDAKGQVLRPSIQQNDARAVAEIK